MQTISGHGILNETRRAKLMALHNQLTQERTSFLSHWRAIADSMAPRRPRWYTEDVNKGDRRNQKIVDNTAVLAARTLRSGMMSGITSPARPWFGLSLADADDAEAGPVKTWLDGTTDRMNSIFKKSNLYNVLPVLYGDLGIFGTAAMLVEEDFDNVIRCHAIPIGSYMIALSDKGRVEIFMREFRMSVRQIITRFAMKDGKIDWSVVSPFIRDRYEANQLEAMIDVVHSITPNDYFDSSRLEAKYKRFRSSYFERGNYSGGNDLRNEDDRFLRESGYDYFPVLCPRWEVTGEDVYATSCPGMDALGDNLQLQLGVKRKAQAVELMVKPPMVGPASLKTAAHSIIPGKVTFVDERSEGKGYRPAFQIEPRVDQLNADLNEQRQRISKTFYEDLFLMLANSDRRQITAREIDERHEEKLLALGPVLEQLNQDLLDPLIDLVFDFMVKRGMIEDPPEQIRGADLKVEYTSIMQQAQKLAGLGGIERFTQYVGGLAQFDPNVLAKVDTAQLVDVVADTLSMRAGIVRSDEQVAQIQEAQAKREQQAAQAQQLQQQAVAAKNLSQTDTEGDNGLTRLMAMSDAGRAV